MRITAEETGGGMQLTVCNLGNDNGRMRRSSKGGVQFYIFIVILASIVPLNHSAFPSLFRAKSNSQIYKVTLVVPMVIFD